MNDELPFDLPRAYSGTADSSGQARQNEAPIEPSLSRREMESAFMSRNSAFDGLFYAAVTTTRIFCKPSCPARKPLPHNVEYYATAREALFAGFRPCKRCRPMETDDSPVWLSRIFEAVDADPDRRFRDAEVAEFGADPATVRRWFKKRYGMTFQAYSRARRLSRAFDAIRSGGSVDEASLSHGWESFSGFREAFGKHFGAPPTSAASPDSPVLPAITVGWIETPLGPMVAGAVRVLADSAADPARATGVDALCLLEFSDRRMLEAQFETVSRRFGIQKGASILRAPLLPGESPVFDMVRVQLTEYFAGKRRNFDVPLALRGSEFQEKAWRALLRIPCGETRSYARLAADLGEPGAARAAGHANGLNRIAILVPCHRVINADGEFGGYGGGLWRKRALLELERGERSFSLSALPAENRSP